MFVSLEQAICDALASWLESQLAGDGEDDVVVEPRWPDVDRQLPPRAITVILAGPRKLDWDQPTIVARYPAPNANTARVAWSVGWLEQSLQLDVWAHHDVELDSLLARLDRPLNAGMRPLGGNVDPVAAGLTIPLSGDWDGFTATLAFGEATRTTSPGTAVEGEWRATVRGVAQARLAIVADSPRLARIRINNKLDGVVETTEIQ